MALSGTVLGNAIAETIISSYGSSMTDAEKVILRARWRTIAGAIVTHITTNAVVNTTVTGATDTGPDGGPLPITSQPGVGTVT